MTDHITQYLNRVPGAFQDTDGRRYYTREQVVEAVEVCGATSPRSLLVGSIATVSDHNAAYDPADDAFGGAFKDGFREGWMFAKDPRFEDREEIEADYSREVDIAPSECWDAYKETYFAMLPLAAIPEVGDPLPTPSDHVVGPQDISTAPKMTDVLVWWPIVQLDEDGEPTEEVVDGRWIISEDQGGYWIEPDVMNAIGDHLGDDFTYADKPSHWMPLPAPLFVATEDQP